MEKIKLNYLVFYQFILFFVKKKDGWLNIFSHIGGDGMLLKYVSTSPIPSILKRCCFYLSSFFAAVYVISYVVNLNNIKIKIIN